MTRRSSGLSNKRINCGSFLAQFILIRYEARSDFCMKLGSYAIPPRRLTHKRECLDLPEKMGSSPIHNISADAVFAPKGLRMLAQGCRVAATLGGAMRESQPQRGCVKKRHGNDDATPLGLAPWCSTTQGSGLRPQPWAIFRSPFGAKEHTLPSSVAAPPRYAKVRIVLASKAKTGEKAEFTGNYREQNAPAGQKSRPGERRSQRRLSECTTTKIRKLCFSDTSRRRLGFASRASACKL